MGRRRPRLDGPMQQLSRWAVGLEGRDTKACVVDVGRGPSRHGLWTPSALHVSRPCRLAVGGLAV